ncbi:hypothetical protein FHT44_004990 [Mycolicibacterium sp. BK634]|nr:hypothetical protein [Mycolicibacterium sp. BK634]
MCSPELVKGMCCICCGTLTPENIYVDDAGVQWDFHRGKCAILGGVYSDPVHEAVGEALIKAFQSLPANSAERHLMNRIYYGFADLVADEDHFDRGQQEVN